MHCFTLMEEIERCSDCNSTMFSQPLENCGVHVRSMFGLRRVESNGPEDLTIYRLLISQKKLKHSSIVYGKCIVNILVHQ